MFARAIRQKRVERALLQAIPVSCPAGLTRDFHSYTQWPILSEEHIMIAETARNFADAELAPIAHEVRNKGMDQYLKSPSLLFSTHGHILSSLNFSR